MSIDSRNWEEIKEFLEKEEVEDERRESRYRGVNEELMREAKQLYELINIKIGKDDNGLYKEEIDASGAYTDTNALMAILAYLLGKRDEAEQLYKLINQEIGKLKSGLYQETKYTRYPSTSDNALMAILAYLLGKKDEAEKLYKLINQEIGKFYSGLYKRRKDDPNRYPSTSDNALMAILAYLLGKKDEAEKLYELINIKIGKLKSGLYMWRKEDSYAFTSANASMAILAYLLGKRDEAEKLYELINKEIGKLDSGLYKRRKDDPNRYPSTYVNALMAIFLVVLARGGIYEHRF
jgi:ABC-type Fe3+-hydroxamate transport system substrate-binding protein